MRKYSLILSCLILLPAFGCGGDGSEATGAAPVIDPGQDRCDLCGMAVKDPSYAPILVTAEGRRRPFDAIECLIQERRQAGGTLDHVEVWLPDLEEDGRLHPQSEMTVVQAGFPSPMGGGYAAFKDEDIAGKLARERDGEIGSLTDFITGKQTQGSEQ